MNCTPSKLLKIKMYVLAFCSSCVKYFSKSKNHIVIYCSVCPADQWLVNLEDGVDQEVANELRRRGHRVNWPITGTLFYLHNYCLWLQDTFTG